MTQHERYEAFKQLHERKGAFVMPDPWDGTSALLCKEGRVSKRWAQKSSAAIAFSLGRPEARVR